MIDIRTYRLTGVVAGALALALPSAVLQAQDSTQHTGHAQQATMDTVADTTRQDSTQWGHEVNPDPAVQNPPGYRGLERPAGLPADSAADSAMADGVDRVGQMKRQESTDSAGDQNPPGYRGMERPVMADSAAGMDTTAQAESVQNPPGYRGLERPAGLADSAAAVDSAAEGVDRVGQMQRQETHDTLSDQNPPGYRGMEQPVLTDSAQAGQQDTLAPPAQDAAAVTDTVSGDSTDVVHREREVPPGVGYAPPPYPADSERAWVEDMPEGDSVSVEIVPSDSTE